MFFNFHCRRKINVNILHVKSSSTNVEKWFQQKYDGIICMGEQNKKKMKSVKGKKG